MIYLMPCDSILPDTLSLLRKLSLCSSASTQGNQESACAHKIAQILLVHACVRNLLHKCYPSAPIGIILNAFDYTVSSIMAPEIYTAVEPLVPTSLVPYRDTACIISTPRLRQTLHQWLKGLALPQIVSIHRDTVTLTW